MDGRNDNYHKNYKERLEIVLNSFLHQIEKFKLQNKIEINFVDFGSKKPLHEELSCINRKNINFLYINETREKYISGNFKGHYNHNLAINIGVRRSKSKFCMFLPSDQFFSENMFHNLVNFLEYNIKSNKNFIFKNFFLIPRKILGRDIILKNPSINQLQNYLARMNASRLEFKSSKIHSNGGMGAFLINRKIYNMIGGPINEKLKFFGWRSRSDNDLLRRVSYLVDHVDLSGHGIYIYKLPYSLDADRQSKIIVSKKNFNLNPDKYFNSYIFDI